MDWSELCDYFWLHAPGLEIWYPNSLANRPSNGGGGNFCWGGSKVAVEVGACWFGVLLLDFLTSDEVRSFGEGGLHLVAYALIFNVMHLKSFKCLIRMAARFMWWWRYYLLATMMVEHGANMPLSGRHFKYTMHLFIFCCLYYFLW